MMSPVYYSIAREREAAAAAAGPGRLESNLLEEQHVCAEDSDGGALHNAICKQGSKDEKKEKETISYTTTNLLIVIESIVLRETGNLLFFY